MALLERVHQQHPTDREVLVALVSMARERNDIATALRHARELLMLSPADAAAARADRRTGEAAGPVVQPSNGSRTRIVSSRSGLVDSSVTGASTSSSIRRTYLTACAGRSAQERAPRVEPVQPSITS